MRRKKQLVSSRWSAEQHRRYAETWAPYLPAIILALAVLVTALLAPGSIVSGLGAIAAAIKALWR